jgi:multidrug efflux pump subunit AcrB
VRFAHFFIDRPVFASVLSILTIIVGSLAICSHAGRAVPGDRAADRSS